MLGGNCELVPGDDDNGDDCSDRNDNAMVIAVMEIKMVMIAMNTMMTMVMINITMMKIARPFGRRRF